MYCEQCQTEVSGKFVDDQFVCQHCETELPLETTAVSASVTQNAKEFLRKWAAQQNAVTEPETLQDTQAIESVVAPVPKPKVQQTAAIDRSDDSLEKLIAEAERKSQELRQRADRLLKEDAQQNELAQTAEIETPAATPRISTNPSDSSHHLAAQHTPASDSADVVRERMAATFGSMNFDLPPRSEVSASQPAPHAGQTESLKSPPAIQMPRQVPQQRRDVPPLPTRRPVPEVAPEITSARIPADPQPSQQIVSEHAQAKKPLHAPDQAHVFSHSATCDETPLPTSSLPDVQLAIDEFRRQRSNWTGFLGQWLGFFGTMAGLAGLVCSVLLAQGKLSVTPLLGYPLAAAGALILILGLSLSVGSAFDILSKQNAWVFEHLLKELRRRDERIQQLAQKIDRQVKEQKKAA